jgi:hypothetical protein
LRRIAAPAWLRLGDLVVLEQRFGASAHLPDRFSAATDFVKASMMLTTLLGGAGAAGGLCLVLHGLLERLLLMISSSRSCTGSMIIWGVQSWVCFLISCWMSGIMSESGVSSPMPSK